MSNYGYIAVLRHQGRSLARELDLLRNPFKDIGLNTASVHILIECDNFTSVTQKQLIDLLKLNKSYISKLVSNLKEKKLIDIKPTSQDKRKLVITLTELGQNVLDEIEDVARLKVQRALDYMSNDEAQKAYEGMTIYTNALKKARQLKGISFRMIEKKDNNALASLIREILVEFKANRDGFAFADPELDKMFEHYRKEDRCRYLVAVKNNEILGGAGIGPLRGDDKSVCELRKMYLSPKARGIGLGDELLKKTLTIALSMDYKQCYLETLSTMSQAISLYRRAGFEYLNAHRGNTGHFGCDTWMIKTL
tara:strand:- start:3469 stop:4392 length:924 start_codon:yes stop_codon:yes gene_type:complete